MEVDAFSGFTLAILLLFIGKGMISRVEFLRHYSIPEALVGGVFCAVIVGVLYYSADIEISFDLDVRDLLLLYFFATIGLSMNVRMLISGGRSLVILTLLAVVFMVLQNIVGMSVAGALGMNPKVGLMAGSISLAGGVGTTMAWAPYFADNLGVANAIELGLSTNMIGIIAACVIGGPIANVLMNRYGVKPSEDTALEVGTLHRDEQHTRIDYYGVLLALFWLNITLMLGEGISGLIALTPLKLPDFVGCLIAGIVLRAVADVIRPDGKGPLWNLPSMQPGLALISDMTLGLFLTMALMGMKLWELQPVLGFITITMILQILLVVVFVLLVVFRFMGGNYEAVVICSGFSGIALGSTATAIVNMTAVTREFGAARQAFIVVPLVCGFTIDLANALVISLMAG